MLNLNFNPFPVISTANLHLRYIDQEDASQILYLRGSEELMKYINKPLFKTLDDARSHIEKIQTGIQNGESIHWGICDKSDSLLIGIIGFHNVDKEHHRSELGYILHDKFWGKGITGEAVRSVIDFGLGYINLHSIEARIAPENIASRKILLRNHFEKEAYFRENFHFEGRYLDTEVYSLIRT